MTRTLVAGCALLPLSVLGFAYAMTRRYPGWFEVALGMGSCVVAAVAIVMMVLWVWSLRNARLQRYADALEGGSVDWEESRVTGTLNGEDVEVTLVSRVVAHTTFKGGGRGTVTHYDLVYGVVASGVAKGFRVTEEILESEHGEWLGAEGQDGAAGLRAARRLRERLPPGEDVKDALYEVFKRSDGAVTLRGEALTAETSHRRGYLLPRPAKVIATLEALIEVARLARRERVTLGTKSVMAWRARTGEGLRCPFCRDDLGERGLVACRGCQTVHHEECCSEAGRCTTLGCTEVGSERVPT